MEYVKYGKIAYWLLIIGGLNWGLYVFGWDLESWLPLGSLVFKVVYALVGLSALWELFGRRKAM